ncbi:hypothetical protein ACVNS2_21845 [Paenibacillus caseinilyticus]|uniref:Uncharacterized protein n=1 Tax=Paenibacillus mucilaginosus K02 TaxID=997761 RepID=I0BLQ5_9BACL|nr:hypothetical protein [Paenibacillus mucilaginosus]AFH63302.1 hypothetical protein B2K_21840 [Paenibacillus mucilaginosus K02]
MKRHLQRFGVYYVILVLLLIIAAPLMTSSDSIPEIAYETNQGSAGSGYSQAFIKNGLTMLEILKEVITYKDIYSDEEREYADRFYDDTYNAQEKAFLHRIMAVQINYFKTLDGRNKETPISDTAVSELLRQIDVLQQELHSMSTAK